MRKEFLKELMEIDGNPNPAPTQNNGQGSENTPNQPEIVVPKDPEQQKKAVQRFLYFINSI